MVLGTVSMTACDKDRRANDAGMVDSGRADAGTVVMPATPVDASTAQGQ